MAVTATPVCVQTPKNTLMNFVEGTDAAGTFKTIYTAGADGSKVTGINAATDADETHLLSLIITRSAVDYLLGAIDMPVTSGTADTIPPVNALAAMSGLPVDNDGQAYLFLESGDTLRATFATAFTGASGHRIDVSVIGGDF